MRLYLGGPGLADVQAVADTPDSRHLPLLELGGEQALGFGGVAVDRGEPVFRSSAAGYGLGYSGYIGYGG